MKPDMIFNGVRLTTTCPDCKGTGYAGNDVWKQWNPEAMDFDAFKVEATKQIPVGRVGYPEDIAAAVSFFCREEASFVSGQVIYVAGGPKA